MSTVKEIKALLLNAAAVAAAPVIARAAASTNYPVDPLMKDENLRLMNVFAFEVSQVLYNAFRLALENNDPAQWPDPVLPSEVKSPVSATPPVSGPIPNPGAGLSGAAQIASTIGAVAGAVAKAIP